MDLHSEEYAKWYSQSWPKLKHYCADCGTSYTCDQRDECVCSWQCEYCEQEETLAREEPINGL
jgi:hypothetical protein